VERRGEVKLDTGECKQLPSKFTCEDRIPIADNGAWKSVEADNVGEERPGHRGRRIGMAQRNEMGELGESVDHCQNDRLAVDLREALHEIHDYVSPYRRWNIQWLKQFAGVELFNLVLLAHDAGSDQVTDNTVGAGPEEVAAQAMQCLLNSFIARAMCHDQDRLHTW
jgi:hypothetical protein